MSEGKRQSRRTVMSKFGLYVDWMKFATEVKHGEADPPDGENFGDMVRTGIYLEEEYKAAYMAYLGYDKQEKPHE
jgi:hypothetical protein